MYRRLKDISSLITALAARKRVFLVFENKIKFYRQTSTRRVPLCTERRRVCVQPKIRRLGRRTRVFHTHTTFVYCFYNYY